jgi:dTDP-4-dehydrorhamnose reductase
MKYQADFENERRWLGWDLLCGKVNPAHPLWNYIIECGIDPNEVLWFSEHRCPPNVIGINHYPLSNRFFDENFEKYPDWSHGNNGRHRYTDIESVRVAEAPFISAEELFKEAWDRYQIPIAITEVHIDAGREDQIRWFMNIWNSSLRLRKIGIPIEAVTAWGLLGHFDWHCLVSRCEGYYESGVFDLRSPNPRPTAIAQMMKDLASKGSYEHPILENPGWWERSTRVVYPRKFTSAELEKRNENYAKITSQNRKPVRPLLITGARGTLGYAFGRICEARGIPYRLLSRDQLDIALPQSVHAAVTEHHPWAVINAAGFVKVDEAEVNQDRCFRENLQGPVNLAEICAKHDIPFVTFSSDLVFDGKQHIPYVEADAINPLNVYGKSKAESEKRVLEIYQNALIIRTGAFFGPWDEYNFITVLLRNLERKLPFPAASDLKVSPTYVPELVNVTLNLLMDGEHGIWHLTNGGEVSWSELAVEVAQRNRFDTSLVLPRAFSEMGQRAPRPPYSALRSERGTLLRNLDRALSQFMEDSTQTSRSAA